jgi:hypothetical protein
MGRGRAPAPSGRHLGDFQTPPGLVAEVLETLSPIGNRWPRVFEPTCGRGHFIAGLLARKDRPREIRAIEIQDAHYQAAVASLSETDTHGVDVEIVQRDLFDIDVGRELNWHEQSPLLVVGNPPWVTNSELGSLSSTNRPRRHNLKGLRGLEALTGSSNFDIAEAIWLKLALELADQRPTIALLCKTSVARSVLQFAHRARLSIDTVSIRRIDAARWFGVTVDACLFCAKLGEQRSDPPLVKGGASGGLVPAQSVTGLQPAGMTPPQLRIPVYANLTRSQPDTVMGFGNGKLIADVESHARWAFADGVCPLDWRQGLKHDADSVMELVRKQDCGRWCNRDGELVDVESDYVYPLVKGTDLTRPTTDRLDRAVVVTQKRLGEDTTLLATQAPRLWDYLDSHADSFSNRKSSIYRGRPPFSLFGIGPYSFAAFKVAVSGMHKIPRFRALGPVSEKPTMLDDTCYFLPCSTAEEAAILTALCNDPITLGLIGSMIFRDSKRPITKKLLERIDLAAVLERSDRGAVLSRASAIMSDDLATERAEPLPDVVERLEQRLIKRI